MGMLIIFSSFGDIVSLYIPRKLKNFPLPTHTLQISFCWIAQYCFIYCSSSGSLVMGMFVILISLQWDFIKSFTSLSCISGLDSPGIGPSSWKRFAKRTFLCPQLHQGCWKIGLKQMSAMLEGHSAVLMLNVPNLWTDHLFPQIICGRQLEGRKKSCESPRSVNRCFH